jgi:type II secretory pathway pseudopilin PulG
MKRDGFGLVEILISSSLLAFVIAGTAQLIIASLDAKKSADFAFAAARQASGVLEQAKSLPFDSPELETGTSNPEVEDGAFPGRLAAARSIETNQENMKRITVVVSDRFSPQKKQAYCLTLCRGLGF